MRIKIAYGFGALALILIPLGAYLSLAVPLIVTKALPQGVMSQKIFYFHVPIAETSLLSFMVGGVAAVLFLIKREKVYDILGYSAIEIGMVFGFLVEFSGIIWDRTEWGVWWTWEPRLVTYFILLLVYSGYFVMRSSVDSESSRARYSAVYAIMASVTAPMTFFSIRFIPGIHPIVFSISGASMESNMLQAFLVTMAGMTCFYISLLLIKISYEFTKDEIQYVKDHIGG